MQGLFELVLYQPIFNAFVWFYNLIPNVAIAIFLLTLLVKILLYPLTASSIRSQKALTDLQPKMDEIKKKYKDDQQTAAKEMMLLYKENKVNPLASCLPLLIQIPIFLALFVVLKNGLTQNSFELLYPFVQSPGTINTVVFGVIDLKNPSVIIAVFAGLAQFLQAYTMRRKRPPEEMRKKEGAKDEDMLANMNRYMLYFMPIMTVLVGFQLPGGVSLYWFFSTILMVLQQYIIIKGADKKPGEIIAS